MLHTLSLLATARGLISLAVLLLALGLAQVLVSMERVDTFYALRDMQAEYRELSEHVEKLQTEWSNRTSPHALAPLGQKYGLARAQPGQRRMLSLDASQTGRRGHRVQGGVQ